MPSQITGVVVAAIIIVASFVMYPILNQTADQLHSSLTEHCETSGDQYTRIFSDVATAAGALYNGDEGSYGGPGVSVSGNAAGECNVAATALPGSGTGTVYSNHGTQVGTVTSSGAVTFASGTQWVMPPDAITRFSGLNNLLTSILPVLMVAGFLTLGVIRGIRSAQGQLQGSVVNQVMGVVIMIVTVTVTPVIFTALGDAALASEAGTWEVNNRFAGLLGLLFAFVPVIYIGGLVTYIVSQARAVLSGRRTG